MRTKKYVIALAIFGGVLFTANATNIIDLNDQKETGVDKRKIKVPTHG
ncbi:hypothetical protein [uncultured Lacinutrix sp.]|nr:hypothetical protein [uncultured Lacinutrix sp.]